MSDAQLKHWQTPLLEDSVSTTIVEKVDYVINLPDSIGTGTSYSTDLDKQCKLMLTEVNFQQDITFEGSDVDLCGVFIMLSGELTLEVAGLPSVTVNKNSAGLFFIGNNSCSCTYKAGHVKMINFSVDVELMTSLAEQYDSSPAKLMDTGQWQIEDSLWTMPVTATINDVIEQIYQCQLSKKARKVYIKAKLMEILTLLFDWHDHQKKQCIKLNTQEILNITDAARLIELHMSNPPNLSELAHLVGINDNKLKKDFKLVFQDTVFGYLHKKRMAKAKQLLIHSQLNVKEIARKVGFKHQGHFATKFKEFSQTTPANFIKQQRIL